MNQLLAAAERDATPRALEALQNPVLAASINQMLINQQAAMKEALKSVVETIIKSMPAMTVPQTLIEAMRNAIHAASVDDAIQIILQANVPDDCGSESIVAQGRASRGAEERAHRHGHPCQAGGQRGAR